MNALDRFIQSHASLIVAFLWGVSEATWFWFVPDVWLTLLACRDVRQTRRATLWALTGALCGGALMWRWGRFDAAAVGLFLDRVPAIDAFLIANVQRQTEAHGLGAVLFGPIKGTPYKIYAALWGVNGGALMPFLLVSIIARLSRFALTSWLSHLASRRLERGTALRLWALGWTVFYGWYFWRMGW